MGMAAKYLNRYNALFFGAYRNVSSLIKRIKQALLEVGRSDYYNSNKVVGKIGLLAIWL